MRRVRIWGISFTRKEGRPCLRIVDAESGQECLHWCCERPPGGEEETAKQEIHRLVSKLLLLSCQQTLCSPADTTKMERTG